MSFDNLQNKWTKEETELLISLVKGRDITDSGLFEEALELLPARNRGGIKRKLERLKESGKITEKSILEKRLVSNKAAPMIASLLSLEYSLSEIADAFATSTIDPQEKESTMDELIELMKENNNLLKQLLEASKAEIRPSIEAASWTSEQEDLLLDLYSVDVSLEAIAEALNNNFGVIRTVKALKSRISLLGKYNKIYLNKPPQVDVPVEYSVPVIDKFFNSYDNLYNPPF